MLPTSMRVTPPILHFKVCLRVLGSHTAYVKKKEKKNCIKLFVTPEEAVFALRVPGFEKQWTSLALHSRNTVGLFMDSLKTND